MVNLYMNLYVNQMKKIINEMISPSTMMKIINEINSPSLMMKIINEIDFTFNDVEDHE